MINSLKDGVVARLNELYPTIKVYTENRTHGISKTAFFVEIEPISIDRPAKNLEEHHHMVNVTFYQEKDIKNNLYNVLENLGRNLVSCLVDGHEASFLNNKSSIVDGLLHYQFEVNFMIILKPEQTGNSMSDIQISI
ncbi:hypothetical protein J5Y03_10090 [Bacillus sp. RG28]|uniref:Uncharacterized protein n=1 Tax=Gottfriedia endophytica TaxID=2820819 RepID=A0A940SGW4_9BACI|nr:hypothetical protein [Gottfriedia endophytica]MBP0725537.1 hypothetical protein [Gottfriedia endophytica]